MMLSALIVPVLLAASAAAAPWTPTWPSYWNGGRGSQGAQCGPAVVALATGIEINIVAQYGELNATLTLIAIESASTFNTTAYLEGKGALVSDVQGGIRIREFNEGLIPQAISENLGSSAVVQGYTVTYANAQLTELSLAESLTGVPTHDLPILETIKGDVMTGIQLNMNNTIAAVHGCSVGVIFPSTS